MKRGRPCIGKRAMTSTERNRRRRRMWQSALRSCLRFINAEIESHIRMSCPINTRGAPILAEMDGLSVPAYRRLLRMRDRILDGLGSLA